MALVRCGMAQRDEELDETELELAHGRLCVKHQSGAVNCGYTASGMTQVEA